MQTTNITLSSGTVTGSGVCNLHIADTFAMQAGDTLAMKIAAFGSTKTMSIPASSMTTGCPCVLRLISGGIMSLDDIYKELL